MVSMRNTSTTVLCVCDSGAVVREELSMIVRPSTNTCSPGPCVVPLHPPPVCQYGPCHPKGKPVACTLCLPSHFLDSLFRYVTHPLLRIRTVEPPLHHSNHVKRTPAKKRPQPSATPLLLRSTDARSERNTLFFILLFASSEIPSPTRIGRGTKTLVLWGQASALCTES